MLQTLIVMLFGAIMFVDPVGFLDKTNQTSASVRTAVDATFGWRSWRIQFGDKPLKHPRRLVIAVRVFGGAIVALGALSLYDMSVGL